MNDIIGIEPLRCKYCNEFFESIDLLKHHLQHKHSKTEFITSDDIALLDLPWLEDQLIIGNAFHNFSTHHHQHHHHTSAIVENGIETNNLIAGDSKLEGSGDSGSLERNDLPSLNGNLSRASAVNTAGTECILSYEKNLERTMTEPDQSCLEKCFSDDCCSCPFEEDCCCYTVNEDDKCCADCADTTDCCTCDCDECCCIM